MHKFKAAKINDGEDWIKLSLIFILTTNPESISRHRPDEANISRMGLTHRPSSKPIEPINWRKPVSFLKFGNPYLSNSKIINFE